MWICQRCYTENQDTSAVCESCGSPRSVGRFSNPSPQRPVQPPRVSSPAPQRETARPRAAARTYAAPEMEYNAKKADRPGLVLSLARFAGLTLSILLPILTALLAWRQYDALSAALLPLLLGSGYPAWAGIALYIALALIAALLSLLPGLWTLLLSKGRQKAA